MYEIDLEDVPQMSNTALSILQEYISSNQESFNEFYVFAEVTSMRDLGALLNKLDCLGSQSSDSSYTYLLVISRRDLDNLGAQNQVKVLTEEAGMSRADVEWPDSYKLFII